MGWYGIPSGACRKDRRGGVNRKATLDEEMTSRHGFPLMSTMRGTVWYAVYQPTDGKPYGLVCLTHIRNGEFSYKPMDETMAPVYYAMPTSYLDYLDEHAPTDGETQFARWARQWRAKCREENQAKSRQRARRREFRKWLRGLREAHPETI